MPEAVIVSALRTPIGTATVIEVDGAAVAATSGTAP